MDNEEAGKKKDTTIMNNEVVILEDSKGELKVIPDYVFLKKKSFVKFFAVNIDVIVMVPKVKLLEDKKELFEKSGKPYSSFSIEAGKQKKVKLKGDIVSGEYPYIVHSLKTHETIKGNSPPSMIIIEDPPENK